MTAHSEGEYRTPEELQFTDEQDARISKVLDQAIHNGVSCILAMMFGEPQDVVERWTDALWNGLREGLSDSATDHPTLRTEDRLAAIVLLLDERMAREAEEIHRAATGAES